MINIVNIMILFEFKLGDFKNQLKVKRKVHSLRKILQVLRIQI